MLDAVASAPIRSPSGPPAIILTSGLSFLIETTVSFSRDSVSESMHDKTMNLRDGSEIPFTSSMVIPFFWRVYFDIFRPEVGGNNVSHECVSFSSHSSYKYGK